MPSFSLLQQANPGSKLRYILDAINQSRLVLFIKWGSHLGCRQQQWERAVTVCCSRDQSTAQSSSIRALTNASQHLTLSTENSQKPLNSPFRQHHKHSVRIVLLLQMV